MASVQSSSYQGRYLKLTVKEAEVNTAENYSDISYKLESIGGEHNYYDVYNWGVELNNEVIFPTQTTYWSSQTFPAAKGSREGTIRVYHKSDGTADPVSFKLKGKIYNSGNEEHTGSISLTPIYRKPSYNSVSASSISEKSVRLTSDIDTKTLSITGGGWDLSTDGGSTWTYYEGNPTDKTITGLNPGTQYWYRGYVTTAGGSANSNWNTFTTKDCVVRQKISGTWKTCIPYIKVSGTWKKAIPYIKANGSWKDGIN
jgi:hypothetical protein